MKIFAINPGSTGMKAALYEDLEMLWSESVSYSEEEIERCKGMPEKRSFSGSPIRSKYLKTWKQGFRTLSRGRQGGLLRPISGGVWMINEEMAADLRSCRYGRHASNFGG